MVPYPMLKERKSYLSWVIGYALFTLIMHKPWYLQQLATRGYCLFNYPFSIPTVYQACAGYKKVGKTQYLLSEFTVRWGDKLVYRSAMMEVCTGCSGYTGEEHVNRITEKGREAQSMDNGFLEEVMPELSLKGQAVVSQQKSGGER